MTYPDLVRLVMDRIAGGEPVDDAIRNATYEATNDDDIALMEVFRGVPNPDLSDDEPGTPPAMMQGTIVVNLEQTLQQPVAIPAHLAVSALHHLRWAAEEAGEISREVHTDEERHTFHHLADNINDTTVELADTLHDALPPTHASPKGHAGTLKHRLLSAIGAHDPGHPRDEMTDSAWETYQYTGCQEEVDGTVSEVVREILEDVERVLDSST